MSYDPGDLSTSALYRVRFMIGDTNTSDEFLVDEEIEYLLGSNANNEGRTAVACIEHILAKFSSDVDYTLGPHSEKLSGRLTNFEKLLKKLKSKLVAATPWSPQFDTPDPTLFEFDIMSGDESTYDPLLGEDEDE